MIHNSTPKALTVTCLTYLALTYSATSAAEQIFVPLDQPCRLVDTRAPGTPFTDNGDDHRQDFLAWSRGDPLKAQGGDNCELPRTGAKPSAIAANITAVSKPFHAKGNLLAYPFTDNDTTSDASLVNFSDNNIANASIISLSPDANKHFSITGNIFNTTGVANSALKTHVVVDVTGYFYEQAMDIHLKNVVTVSQQGDGFTDPIAAMDSIRDKGDASSSNPYLLDIGPGNFNLRQALKMIPYVTIKGAGVGQTILQGQSSTFDDDPGSSVMIGADHAIVTNLTLSNTRGSGGTHRRGIINKNVTPTIENVKIELTGLQHCTGILNEQAGSHPIITHVDINVDCANTAYGIFNFLAATPVVSHTNITATGGITFSDGIHNSSSSATTIVRHSTIKGSQAGIRSVKGAKSIIAFSQISGGIIDNDNDGSINHCGHSINADTNTALNAQCL